MDDDDGDILVFLPGKGEIFAAERALKSAFDGTILTLHGGLTLHEQNQVFSQSDQRRVILSTNVAETSITVPGITCVIDAGLVRRTNTITVAI